MSFEVETLENYRFNVHLTITYCYLQFFDRMLASLILTLDGNDNPVVEDIENLEGLAGDLVQDQTCPSE